MSVKDWWRGRVEARMRAKYKKGYDFAAGGLLRGELTPEEVDEHAQESRDFDAYDAFDEGAQCAADHWRARQRLLT